jgi:hypothetical protein
LECVSGKKRDRDRNRGDFTLDDAELHNKGRIMSTIESLEQLKHIRDEALQKLQMKAAPGNIQVIVAMGSCGIAAGARDTMKSVLKSNLAISPE